MKPNRAERVRSYLEMIASPKGGLEAVRDAALTDDLEERAAAAAPLGLPAGEAAAKARSGFEAVELKRLPADDQAAVIEAIIIPALRPAVDVVDGSFRVAHPLWRHFSDDPAIRERLERAIASIGRIELFGLASPPYGGTGFVVGPNLLMTNRHVAQLFANGLGTSGLLFKPGLGAGLDLRRERVAGAGTVFTLRRLRMIHPYWDMALLEVEGLPASAQPLPLSLLDARDLAGRDVAVVGYPAYDPRNAADDQQQVFGNTYMVKRLQPGDLQGRYDIGSFGKLVPAATHDCSTLGGNSGSAVIDADSGEVLALHFGGRTYERNYAVPAAALARDDKVIACGVAFAGSPPGGPSDWEDWWSGSERAASTAPARGTLGSAPDTAATVDVATPTPGGSPGAAPTNLHIEIPITISVSLDGGQPQVSARVGKADADAALTEAMREPEHDTNYGSRRGYDPLFLAEGADAPVVPMPQPKRSSLVARTLTGETVLPYENFSIAMHARRRLALFSAANVTKERRLRRPEPGRDYTRDGLAGLREHDMERWFLDPRLDARFQLPDVFFTKDRKAFDKGHVVRRDDVAWGETYETLKRANGDSYHVTNCSPQVLGFNRSGSGEDNWGDLENDVLSQAAKERLCVFAGPVLERGDPFFMGVGDGGTALRVQIPQRYWKVVVAATEEGLAAFGFLLEQDLSDVEWEFLVSAEFIPKMRPLPAIADLAKVTFDPAILEADQYGTERGLEVVFLAGATPVSDQS